MKRLRPEQNLEFEGQHWRVVALDGTEVVLRSLRSGTIQRVPLVTLLNSESFFAQSPGEFGAVSSESAVLAALSDGQGRRVESIHQHVVELLTGQSPRPNDDGAPSFREEYDPAKPIRQRLEAKVAELRDTELEMSPRTLARKVKGFRERGLVGLIDKRTTKLSTTTGRIDPRVVSILEDFVTRQTEISTGTRTRIITQVTAEARKSGLPIPSRSTLYRALHNLTEPLHTFGSSTTRRSQANRPKNTYRHQAPSRPGELVEIDSTSLDLMVILPDGTPGRAELTIAIDVATRTICATILTAGSTKAVDAAVLLARSLTPLPMQPGWNEALSFSRSILPPDMLENEATLNNHIAARPVIFPESITIDRGKIYVGKTFQRACESLQISTTMAASHTPTDKPHVERAFRAINTQFTQFLTGYLGGSVTTRGKDPAKDALWSIAQIQDLLDQWIVAEWQNRPHPGLRLPGMPKADLTPNEMFKALHSVAPTAGVVLDREDYIGLLPLEWRAINLYGVNFHRLVYDADELSPYRARKSGIKGEPAKNRWQVRYDPYRMNSIFVRDHLQDKWIEAKWTLGNMALAPFSLDVLRAAVAAVATRNHELPANKILGEINRIQTRGVRSAKETKAANREALTVPIVPPAAETSIHPPEGARSDGPVRVADRVIPARRIDEG